MDYFFRTTKQMAEYNIRFNYLRLKSIHLGQPVSSHNVRFSLFNLRKIVVFQECIGFKSSAFLYVLVLKRLLCLFNNIYTIHIMTV